MINGKILCHFFLLASKLATSDLTIYYLYQQIIWYDNIDLISKTNFVVFLGLDSLLYRLKVILAHQHCIWVVEVTKWIHLQVGVFISIQCTVHHCVPATMVLPVACEQLYHSVRTSTISWSGNFNVLMDYCGTDKERNYSVFFLRFLRSPKRLDYHRPTTLCWKKLSQMFKLAL